MRLSGFSIDEIILLEQWTQWDIARQNAEPLRGLRSLVVALRITFRAARTAFLEQPAERLQIVGSTLVFDHPAGTFLTKLVKEGVTASAPRSVELTVRTRVRCGVTVAMMGMQSLPAFCRYLALGGTAAAAHLTKGLVTFGHAGAAFRQLGCEALVVTHDLLPRPYFTALAASRAGVPVWMALLDHEVSTTLPIRIAGVAGYQSHDACGLMPQPPLFFEYPVLPRRRQSGHKGALRGLVLLPHPHGMARVESAAFLVRNLLEDPRVVRIRVRPHPAHPVELRDLPPGAELDDMSGLIEDSLDDVDFAVGFADSSAIRTLRRFAVPIVIVAEQSLREEVLALRWRLDELTSTDVVSSVELDSTSCTHAVHPHVSEFAELRGMLPIAAV